MLRKDKINLWALKVNKSIQIRGRILRKVVFLTSLRVFTTQMLFRTRMKRRTISIYTQNWYSKVSNEDSRRNLYRSKLTSTKTNKLTYFGRTVKTSCENDNGRESKWLSSQETLTTTCIRKKSYQSRWSCDLVTSWLMGVTMRNVWGNIRRKNNSSKGSCKRDRLFMTTNITNSTLRNKIPYRLKGKNLSKITN